MNEPTEKEMLEAMGEYESDIWRRYGYSQSDSLGGKTLIQRLREIEAIRRLIEDSGKGPRVTEEFLMEWSLKFITRNIRSIECAEEIIKEMFQEAGVEVVPASEKEEGDV